MHYVTECGEQSNLFIYEEMKEYLAHYQSVLWLSQSAQIWYLKVVIKQQTKKQKGETDIFKANH